MKEQDKDKIAKIFKKLRDPEYIEIFRDVIDLVNAEREDSIEYTISDCRIFECTLCEAETHNIIQKCNNSITMCSECAKQLCEVLKEGAKPE